MYGFLRATERAPLFRKLARFVSVDDDNVLEEPVSFVDKQADSDGERRARHPVGKTFPPVHQISVENGHVLRIRRGFRASHRVIYRPRGGYRPTETVCRSKKFDQRRGESVCLSYECLFIREGIFTETLFRFFVYKEADLWLRVVCFAWRSVRLVDVQWALGWIFLGLLKKFASRSMLLYR